MCVAVSECCIFPKFVTSRLLTLSLHYDGLKKRHTVVVCSLIQLELDQRSYQVDYLRLKLAKEQSFFEAQVTYCYHVSSIFIYFFAPV